MKLKSAARVAISIIVFLAPALALAQPYTQTVNTTYSFGFTSSPDVQGTSVGGVANNILFIINSILIPLLFALAFIVFLYGVAKAYIFSHGDPAEVGKGHKLILWGVVGFVVMVSLWGLVNVVANTFGLDSVGAPELPMSY